MAGGIGQRPFTLNPKCVAFSLMCMILYQIRPTKSFQIPIMILLFVASYTAMAWYDYYFDCRTEPMERGTKSVTGMLKPKAHVPETQERPSSCHKHNIIYLLHSTYCSASGNGRLFKK